MTLPLAREAHGFVRAPGGEPVPEGRFVFADVPSGWYPLVTSGYQPGVTVLPPGGGGPRQADIMLTRPQYPAPSWPNQIGPTAAGNRRAMATWRYPPSEGHVNRYVTAPHVGSDLSI